MAATAREPWVGNFGYPPPFPDNPISLKGAIMVKVKQMLAGLVVASSLGLTPSFASAQYSGWRSQPAPQTGSAPQPSGSRGDYRPSGHDHDGGRRPDGGNYRDGREARVAYDGGRHGNYVGYGRDSHGSRNGYYPNRDYPAQGYAGYRHAPIGYAPVRGYGPVGYGGWARGGVYAPAVVVAAPAYRGWGIGYGYVAAPVVIAAPVYRGWGYLGF